MAEKNCLHCGQGFNQATRPGGRGHFYCSKKCRQAAQYRRSLARKKKAGVSRPRSSCAGVF